jgi:hypothetical protein
VSVPEEANWTLIWLTDAGARCGVPKIANLANFREALAFLHIGCPVFSYWTPLGLDLTRAGHFVPVLMIFALFTDYTDAFAQDRIEDQWQPIQPDTIANLEFAVAFAAVGDVHHETTASWFFAGNGLASTGLFLLVPHAAFFAVDAARFTFAQAHVPIVMLSTVHWEQLALTPAKVVNLILPRAGGR